MEMGQYKIVDFALDYRGKDPEDILNSFGREGWELVAITPRDSFGPTAYLKRKTHASS